jgi:hypothetical protein
MKLITLLLIISCTFSYPFKKNDQVGLRGFGPRTPESLKGEFDAKKYNPVPPGPRIPIPTPPPKVEKQQEQQQQQQVQQEQQEPLQQQSKKQQRPTPIFIRGEPIPKYMTQSRDKIRQQAIRREQLEKFDQPEKLTQEELQQALAPVYEQLLEIRDKLDNDEQLTEQQILDLLVMLPELDVLQPLIKELSQFSENPQDVQSQEVQNTYDQLKEIQNQVN